MFRNLIAAALALAFASTPSHALTFTFSFSNVDGNVSGIVSGEIFGLTDNATSAASAVVIENGPASLGLSLPITAPPLFGGSNSFTVASGVITDSFFQATFAVPGQLVHFLIASPSVPGLRAGLLEVDDLRFGTNNLVDTPTSPIFAEVPVPLHPLPPALQLFFTGIGAMALFFWRRKRKASALAA
jgi:hypothetical protein